MKTGQLNKYITWQYPTRVSDSMGGHTETWVDACSVWAAIWPISARERAQFGQAAMDITSQIRIRYRNPFMASWRGKYGDRYFNIISIVNVREANEWLDLLCKEEFAK